ncbi:SRA-YDG domain-containing protein [Mycolicibacter sinensis]|uniref:SRA-YDG domain-containing protein n=1 Tax=Mycolicibacter sinensis (strain JDM601) TaxID=875328 RepID=A0A1A2XXH0_MYCSD|nr:SRA-YDG domain-containing protein [Mycolicibacter sinensis]
MAERVFGHIPNNPVGTTYVNRQAAYRAGVHRQLQAGICGGADGTESIVVSGGYIDDEDHGDAIIYTGQGGRDPDSGRQIADQELIRGNLGLARSHLDGLPVRVIRGFEGDKTYSPATGYRYDGLFRVDEYWQETGTDGYRIWRFRLSALANNTALPPEAAEASIAPLATERVETTVQRIVRNTKVAAKVKALHNYTCQVCGTRLETAAGPYAEAAHIRALGAPHNGPDTLENLLCLCPNDHVLFDTGAIFVDSNGHVVNSGDGAAVGRLATRSGHMPDQAYLAYHRRHFAGIYS